jgi:hypothetical protein
MSGDTTLWSVRLHMIDTVLLTTLHATKSTNHATLIGISFSGITRWLNQDCACSRLFLALRKLQRAATHNRLAKPIPAPIPALAPMLRPAFEVEGALSAIGSAVVVGVAAVLAESGGEAEVEDVEVVLLDEAEDEVIDSVVTVVLAWM